MRNIKRKPVQPVNLICNAGMILILTAVFSYEIFKKINESIKKPPEVNEIPTLIGITLFLLVVFKIGIVNNIKEFCHQFKLWQNPPTPTLVNRTDAKAKQRAQIKR